jgi:hypothetical protein
LPPREPSPAITFTFLNKAPFDSPCPCQIRVKKPWILVQTTERKLLVERVVSRVVLDRQHGFRLRVGRAIRRQSGALTNKEEQERGRMKENGARDRGRARNSTNTSHEHESRFYFPASSSFIACRANEKSRTSSSGRFFSPTRAIIASISRSVIMPSRLSVLSSPS